jgi:hypothetical protein
MNAKPYDSKVLTEVAHELLYDEGLTLYQIAHFAADLLGECEAIAEEAEQRRLELLSESGGPDDSSYRRDMVLAGRGYLLK